MKKKLQNNKGFTLIELILYMGLFSILIGILTSVFMSILNNQLHAETIASTDENGRYLLQRLTYDINKSKTINTPVTSGMQTNNLQLTINNINYSYSLDVNGNVQIKDITNNLGPYNLNDYDTTVSAMTFKRIGSAGGANTIQVGFTVISTIANKTNQSKSFVTTIGNR